MNQTKLNFFIILLILIPFPALSFQINIPEKPLRFEHITTKEGLSYPNVYGIFQDHRGFLWFATKYGLNRYDGLKCTVYTHDFDNPHSLSNNYTWSFFEDSVGNLWIVTYGGGISIFNPKTESFNNFLNEPDHPHSLSNNFSWYIFEDSKKRVWIATDGGLNYFDSDTETFTHFIHDPDDPNSLSHNTVTMITEDKQGFLWLGTFGGGLNQFDPKTKRFIHYQYHPHQSAGISDNRIHFVFIDRQEILWIGTERGLNRLDVSSYVKPMPKNDFIQYFRHPKNPNSLPHNRVRSMYEDKNGGLWFATGGGLSLYNRQKNTFYNYQLESNNPNSLNHNSLYYVTGDQTGTLWIGTANGVNKLDPAYQQFALYLSGLHIHSIFENVNGNLLVGTNDGLKHIHPYKNNIDLPEVLDSLKETIVTKIVSDNAGRLWIASQGDGLYRYDPQQKSYKHYQYYPDHTNRLSSNVILDIAVGQDGIVWIAFSNSGIDRLDPEQDQFQHYKHETNNENSLISNWVRSILIDSSYMVWIGTEGGVSRFNPKTESFTHYCYKRNDPDCLSDNTVNMIVEDSQNNIWIATNGGLSQFNPSTNNFTLYRKKNGLPGNSIAAILADNDGHLWMSTNNGLSKFDPHQKTFRNYDFLDGLQGKQFIYHSACMSRDGKLYFGGSNGLNGFYPEKIEDNPIIPEVYLTDFRLFNQSVPIGADSPLKQHISYTKAITLSHEQNVFSFDFIALNYRASKKNQYAYMLEGVDNDWIFTDSSHRTAKYTNINPGTYIFRVKASNNHGIWNEKGISLTISLLPAFWMTWWFKGILMICFIGCGIFTYYWRLRAIKSRNIKLEKLIAERTKALTESKGRYQELFDTINSGVAVFKAVDNGKDFIIREFNRAGENIEGVQRKDILGKRISIVFPGVIDSHIFSMIKDVWENGGIKYFSPVVYKNPKGESWRENYMYRLPSGEVVSVYNDVTERMNSEIELREAKKRAEKSDKAKSQFLANMSHELRTPLNAILGYTQTLRKDNQHLDGLNVIHKCGKHLLTLINDILDFAKIEAYSLKLYPAPVMLSNFLDSVVLIMKIAAHQKDIQFIFEPSSDLPKVVTIDAKRLRQVLLNLLGNAVKFTNKGWVAFKVKRKVEANHLVIIQFEIQDTGIGIHENQLSAIFKPFEQVDHLKKHAQGTGLGLSISQQLVDLMGGKIQVKSEIGKGSIFKFDISVSETTQEFVDSQKNQSSKIIGYSKKSQKKMRILIVDDIEENRQILVDWLLPTGLEVIQAINGRDGLEKAITSQPDLILMDMIMPVMDGYQAVQEIRNLPELKDTFIIAVSADVTDEAKEKSLLAGFNDFISKPIDEKNLFDMMAQYLVLEWIYEEPEKSNESKSENFFKDAEIIPPPSDVLTKLYDLARFGNMELIQQQAKYIGQLGKQYGPFAQKINQLASEYEDETIVSFVKQVGGF